MSDKKIYTAQFTKMIEMSFSIDVEASNEDEAWKIAENRRQEALDAKESEWECMGTDTNLVYVDEI